MTIYNQKNIFADIISGKAICEKLYEDDALLAIKDINPAAPIHIIAMPKKQYIDISDFVTNANDSEIAYYFKTLHFIANANGANEYRLVSNKGALAGQSVFHFHTHILSGGNSDRLLDNAL